MPGDYRYAHVLGVDPGETTGLAAVRFDTVGVGAALVWADQLPWRAAADEIGRRSQRWADRLAVERYVVNAKTSTKGQAPVESAIGMVGVCRLAGGLHGVEVVLETASSAKKLVTDQVLKNLRLWSPGLGHANDAARQAVLMAVKRGWLTGRALLGAPQ